MIRRPPRSPLFPYTPLFPPRLLPTARCPLPATHPHQPEQQQHPPRHHLSPMACGLSPPTATEATNNNKRRARSEEHTSELQSLTNIVYHLLLVKKRNVMLSA